MMVNLSHKLSESTPFYEGLARPRLERLYDLSRGDACNSFYLRTSNHCGTHVDGPWHFNPDGRRISDYDIGELVFTRPAIVDVAAGAGHLILSEDLHALNGVRTDCDILLLRTRFGAFRDDAAKYVNDSPGFSRSAAETVIEKLPALRALAVDFMSVADLRHAEQGAEAHRVFLGCSGYSDRNVLLIEDARLPADLRIPDRVIVVPWFFEGLDSAPCTMIAEYTPVESASERCRPF
jgi:kynurenine formamidase